MEAQELVERYGDMVWRLALARTGRRQDAEDLFQEVFLRCVKYAPTLQSPEHAKAWLLRCTIHRSNSLWSDLLRRPTVPLEEETAAEIDEEAAQVYAAVMALRKPYRTAIHLHYYEGLSVAEIARLSGKTEGTVKSWLHRGRAMLKGALEDEVS